MTDRPVSPLAAVPDEIGGHDLLVGKKVVVTAAAAIRHPGIVQIYEVGQEDGIHFIAQEYVAGRNLGEVIRSSGSLAPGR